MTKAQTRKGRSWVKTGALTAAILGGVGVRRWLRGYSVRRIARPARTLSDDLPSNWQLDYEEVWFTTRDGVKLHGWWIPAQNSKAAIIMAHGYTGCKEADLRFAKIFNQHGYSAFMFDFRGHGQSEGPYGTSLAYMERLDIHAAVDWLLGRGETRLALFGISMGAAAGIVAAGENPNIGAVIADSPFAHLYRSIATEAAKQFRLPMPVAHVMGRFSAKALADYFGYKVKLSHPAYYVGKIAPRPLLLIHGENDGLTPVENTRILYRLAGEPKEMWILPGVEHAACYDALPEEYLGRIFGFLERVKWPDHLWQGIPEKTLDGQPVLSQM